MKKLIFGVTLILVISQGVFSQQTKLFENEDSVAQVTKTLPAELDQVLRKYEQGWRNYNADELSALFTPDGFILRPDHLPVQGRKSIAKAYRNSGGPLHLHPLSFAQADSIAYIIGMYSSELTGPYDGKFILTLRLLPDGKWYISADMDNSNARKE